MRDTLTQWLREHRDRPAATDLGCEETFAYPRDRILIEGRSVDDVMLQHVMPLFA